MAYPRRFDTFSNLCPECNDSRILAPNQCSECGRILHCSKCLKKTCKFYCPLCRSCEKNHEHNKDTKELKAAALIEESILLQQWLLVGLVLILFGACGYVWYFAHPLNQEDISLNLIRSLKRDFPSQRNETWFHFLSVLEKEHPTVKSIIFLHGDDKRTSDCLTKKLVSLYSGNENIRSEEITFSSAEYEAMDYGFALQHYHQTVEMFGVFITDLAKVPANISRIFHSLCDEVSSDVKPSLFIFTLKFDERMVKLKPMQRATTILREVWSDLPENEIYPLLSRIIKIVVDVVPEKNIRC